MPFDGYHPSDDDPLADQKWLEDVPDVGEAIREAAASLGPFNLRQVELTDVDLSGLDFGRATLSDVTFHRCRLTEVDLSAVLAAGCEFVDCNLGGATLGFDGIGSVTLRRCKFVRTNLQGVTAHRESRANIPVDGCEAHDSPGPPWLLDMFE